MDARRELSFDLLAEPAAPGAPQASQRREGGVIPAEQPGFRWVERGAGEPILLLHGLFGAVEHWGVLTRRLRASYRVIVPALPIFEAPPEELTPPGLAEYVRRLMDALDLPPSVVGGNSLGGHVALELALAHPDRLTGLILTGSSGLFERGFTRGVPHRPTLEYVREKMEEVVYDPALITPEWVAAVQCLLARRDAVLRVLQVARAAKRRNIAERLAEIRVPTLLVWGEQDRVTPPEVAEHFHTLIPDSTLIFLPRCGHTPMLEHPEAFAAIVEAWLRETRARRAPSGALAGATW